MYAVSSTGASLTARALVSLSRCAVLWVALALGGCDSKPVVDPPKPTPPEVTSVRVTRSVNELLPGETATLDAEVQGTGAFNAAVSWTVQGGGALSATTGAHVTYTAPATVDADVDVTVTATSVASPGKAGAATLSLKAPRATKVEVTTTDSTLFARESTSLDAAITGLGAFPRGLSWTVTGGGTLSATTGEHVVYTAPETVDADTQVTIQVASVGTPGVSSSLTLTLRTSVVSKVTVQASGTELLAKETVTLEASLTGEGPFRPDVSWTLEGGGSLSATTGSSIVYTAPDDVNQDAPVTITATSAQAPTLSASWALTLKAPDVTVTVSAARAQLLAGNTVVFTATVSGKGPFTPEVDWTVVSGGGTVQPLAVDPEHPDTRSARYTAPSTTAAVTATVRATARAHVTRSGGADVRVMPVPLSITEVSSATESNWPGWLELRNNTDQPLQLSDYALRAESASTKTLEEQGIKVFPLPSRVLAPGAYIVVAGLWSSLYNFDSDQVVWVKEGASTAPLWSGDTFIELARSDLSETIDFVRFGASTDEPLTEGAWTGTSNVAAVPTDGSESFSFARTPGASDTNGAGDWSSRPFSTPAGPNDVPADGVDADADGIPDSAEVEGGRFAGLDLYAMGARTGQRDLFIEVDHMQSSDPGIVPQRAALDKMVAVFAGRGIRVHLDTGTLFSPDFDPANHNLGQGNPEVPYAVSINLTRSAGQASSVYELKSAHMDFARRAIFHYCIFGSSQELDGSAGSSGRAEIVGNDLLVTLGEWGLNTDTEEERNRLINYQASTFMHELGHNLSLRHGGDTDANLKPNYLSIMNYVYQLSGLGPTAGSAAGDRYFYRFGLKGYDSQDLLVDSPLGTTFVMDYSDGTGSSIDENAVNEAAGLGRPGSTPVDFDDSGAVDTPSADLNRSGTFEVLRDYNDWANILLPFALKHSAANGSSRRNLPPVVMSVVRDEQPLSEEQPPPPAFFEWLRSSR